jgi:hypothetical protein
VPDPLLSPSWYRVASLRPRLRKQARFHRHVYRGQVWYVVQDRASGRCQRLTPSAYQIVGLMDGRRTTQELWEAAGTRLGDEGPTQDETIRLLGLLHARPPLRRVARRGGALSPHAAPRAAAVVAARDQPALVETSAGGSRRLPRALGAPGGTALLARRRRGLRASHRRRPGLRRRERRRDRLRWTESTPGDAQSSSALARVPAGQGTPRARARRRHQGVGRRGPRDGNHVPGAGPRPLRGSLRRLGLSGEGQTHPGGGGRDSRGARPRLAGAARVARGRARSRARRRLRGDVERPAPRSTSPTSS